MRIYLQYNDMESGLVRFCQLMLQQDLLGAWSFISEAGIQGQAGRVTKKQFADIEAGEVELIKARDRLLGKGYKVVFIKAMNQN